MSTISKENLNKKLLKSFNIQEQGLVIICEVSCTSLNSLFVSLTEIEGLIICTMNTLQFHETDIFHGDPQERVLNWSGLIFT